MRKSPWQKTAAACRKLGVSRSYLQRLVARRQIKSGYHYRDIRNPESSRPTYQWHTERLDKFLSMEPDKK